MLVWADWRNIRETKACTGPYLSVQQLNTLIYCNAWFICQYKLKCIWWGLFGYETYLKSNLDMSFFILNASTLIWLIQMALFRVPGVFRVLYNSHLCSTPLIIQHQWSPDHWCWTVKQNPASHFCFFFSCGCEGKYIGLLIGLLFCKIDMTLVVF